MKAVDFLSKNFGLMEGWFKTVSMRDYIQRWERSNNRKFTSLSEAEQTAIASKAAEQANKAIFDYSAVPGWLRELRRFPIGAPFITFGFKAPLAVARGLTTNPQKFIKYLIIPHIMTSLAVAMAGGDDDDYDKLMNTMPSYMKDKGSVFIVPFKDENNKWQAFDFGYMLPWEIMMNSFMTALNEDKNAPEILFKEFGMLGGPVPQLITAMLSGQDTFTQQPIMTPGATTTQRGVELGSYIYNMWVPSFISQYGFLGRFLDYMGVEKTPFNTGQQFDKFGDPNRTLGQIALKTVGMNVTPFSENQGRQSNLMKFKKEEDDIIAARAKMMKNVRNISPESRAKQLRDYNELLKQVREKRREFVMTGTF
jgi:hypothetical protein